MSDRSRRILVAEDDPGVRSALRRALSAEGYEVEVAADGIETLEAARRDRPELIVLDVMMPEIDGLEVCRRLRSRGDDTPVLILTARDRVSDRVAGLDAGADDYLVKPFALAELLARVRALLRRIEGDGEEGELRAADMRLDPARRRVWRGDREIRLTRTEFALLELLMRHPDIVLTRDVIYERIWGYDFDTSSNSLEVYVGYLRRKTEAAGEPRLIQTVRGIGYVLREP